MKRRKKKSMSLLLPAWSWNERGREKRGRGGGDENDPCFALSPPAGARVAPSCWVLSLGAG